MSASAPMQPDVPEVAAPHPVIVSPVGSFAALSRQVAAATNRPARDLLRRALLEAPRLADRDAVVATDLADALIGELASEMPPTPQWRSPCADSPVADLGFWEIDRGRATAILERFHYLRSGRADARHFGLGADPESPTVVFSISPIDVDSLAAVARAAPRPAVLSRVFGFAGSPQNSISYGLAQLRRHVQATTGSLVTYLNPNLGFDGTSYRASGWTLVGMETLDSYAYVDGRYRSQRQLAEDRIPEEDVTRSVMALQPLHIYARGIDSPDSPARLFPSPSLRPGAET